MHEIERGRRLGFIGPALILWMVFGATMARSTDEPCGTGVDCDCYYSKDCQSGRFCGYKSTCTKNLKDSKPMDGYCTKSSTIAPGDAADAAKALNLWLLGLEFTSSGAGGSPDQCRVSVAEAVPLTAEKQAAVKSLAIEVEALYLGLESYYPEDLPHLFGSFTLPPISGDCTAPWGPGDNGTVDSATGCMPVVSTLVRRAVTMELASPGNGWLDYYINQIRIQCPSYQSYGRCEYPHPIEHGHPFPYADGVDCLRVELRAALDSVLVPPSAVPSFNVSLGAALIGALMLTGGLWLRRHRAR